MVDTYEAEAMSKAWNDRVWLGTSVEDQARADERIPHLLKVPAAVRFLSCEPLLGPLDLDFGEIAIAQEKDGYGNASVAGGIDWVIVGGESGPGARPMHPCWARAIRDQCQAAGVPFFFKQWGEWKPYSAMTAAEAESLYIPVPAGQPDDSTRECRVRTVSFPPHPLPRGGPVDLLFRLGKDVAGRLLGGREWSESPKVAQQKD